MSWMQKLYRTYESVKEKGLGEEGEPLTPIGHTLQTAHIVVVLNGAGEFQTARVMPPKTTIMLPATEASESRTSGEAPHPLADKIQYVAKDYADYGGEKKAYFDGYLKQLQSWCDSPFAHPKVKAVLDYVKKGKLVADLVQTGILPLDENGKVAGKWEQEGEAPPIFSVLPKTKGEMEFGSALVCWCVEISGDVRNETWMDKTVQQSWIDYAASSAEAKGFCLVQGEEAVISEMHPAKLRHTGDKAKLISSNDTAGYTFRGRFIDAQEAASISADVSAKAHSALRWLIARQGIRNGDQVAVAWAIGAEALPSPLQDNYDYLDDDADDGQSVEAASDGQKSSKNWSENIGWAAAAIIKKKLHGYRAKLNDHQQISLLMLDSATPGRMALTYYQEFLPDDYFANLDAWVDDFSWYQRYSRETKEGKKTVKRTIWPCLPPSPYAIYETIYGKAADKDGKIKRQLYARLLPVIAGGQTVPMPDDLVRQSFQVACQPSGYEHWEWERNIGVACALYKGWRARHYDSSQKRAYSMDLDIENRSRDYLFGRLLAVAEKLESTALRIADEDRATTAERYMQRFVVRPLSTWLQIEANLTKSYKDRLRNNRYMGFLRNREKEIDEIMFALNELRDKTGCSLDAQLDGEFLLGYHSQKMAYRNQSNAQAQPDTQNAETENN
ncbi:type I-C CRISPR-associated protein Cas8c/Csd1 [Lysobacteraceae bacterium NML03-0222]|nr:type I-C CRISPR-associated protein Cas8c/Csd1 [Xanthomonadaceae bacterium NML03-0222]